MYGALLMTRKGEKTIIYIHTYTHIHYIYNEKEVFNAGFTGRGIQ